MMKKLLLSFLLVLSCALCYGQDELLEAHSEDGRIHWTSWDKNWYISAGVGVNGNYVHPDIQGLDLDMSLTYDLAVGKWVLPFVGFQAQYTEIFFNGTAERSVFADSDGSLTGGMSILHADLVFNLSSIISGYKQDRFYELHAYLGAGMAISHGQGTRYVKDYPVFGAINNFRISDAWFVKLEMRTTLANASHYGFDNEYRRKRVIPFSTTIGFTYNIFKRRDFDVYRDRDKVITEYVDRYIERPTPEPQPQPVIVADTVEVERVVFRAPVIHFELNSSTLSKSARVNLGIMARAIAQIPEDRVFTIVGHCDVQTGSSSWNEGLSARRAQSVYDALVNEFGVDPARLKMEHKGGVDLMFYDDNTLSRVVTIH